ncbi:OsmC family protein [Allosalinactinospora lopnorensis]|uniref:OsmC family protein n=1 Tax=Allosalinactinospora lopnorensis TaxID=1352348 RepID=UPI0006988F93|nr:OsmC family protein [Allosalinactinospora lopnorensis]
MLHSPQDETIGVESARAIYEAARDAASFVAVDGADHLLTRSQDSGYVADIVAAWAGRSLAAPEASDRSSPGEADGPRATVVTEAGGNGYAQHITIGPHTLVADEPASAGGTDIGPAPYDLLLAALGACTSMTLRMYAQRKGWPLRNATVTLRHSRIHAEDCEHCETEEGRIDHIRREISIEGDLDDDQRAALMEIADKCPVHRTLHSEVVVESHPAVGG